MGWRERGEGGEECLLETEEEKSYSARSLQRAGHPRLPPASPAVPHSPGRAAPAGRAGLPLSIASLEPSEPTRSCLISPRTEGFRLSEPFMNESRRSREQGPRKVQNNSLLPPSLPSPTLLVSLKLLLFLTFSPPNRNHAFRGGATGQAQPSARCGGSPWAAASRLCSATQTVQPGPLCTPKPGHRLTLLGLETALKSHENLQVEVLIL